MICLVWLCIVILIEFVVDFDGLIKRLFVFWGLFIIWLNLIFVSVLVFDINIFWYCWFCNRVIVLFVLIVVIFDMLDSISCYWFVIEGNFWICIYKFWFWKIVLDLVWIRNFCNLLVKLVIFVCWFIFEKLGVVKSNIVVNIVMVIKSFSKVKLWCIF